MQTIPHPHACLLWLTIAQQRLEGVGSGQHQVVHAQAAAVWLTQVPESFPCCAPQPPRCLLILSLAQQRLGGIDSDQHPAIRAKAAAAWLTEVSTLPLATWSCCAPQPPPCPLPLTIAQQRLEGLGTNQHQVVHAQGEAGGSADRQAVCQQTPHGHGVGEGGHQQQDGTHVLWGHGFG